VSTVIFTALGAIVGLWIWRQLVARQQVQHILGLMSAERDRRIRDMAQHVETNSELWRSVELLEREGVGVKEMISAFCCLECDWTFCGETERGFVTGMREQLGDAAYAALLSRLSRLEQRQDA
jgi:hypothetical protein